MKREQFDPFGFDFYPPGGPPVRQWRTAGRRRALKALARRKRINKDRIAQGKKPIIGGKKVAMSTFRRKTGASARRRS